MSACTVERTADVRVTRDAMGRYFAARYGDRDVLLRAIETATEDAAWFDDAVADATRRTENRVPVPALDEDWTELVRLARVPS